MEGVKFISTGETFQSNRTMCFFTAVDFLSSAAYYGGDHQRYHGDGGDEHNGGDGTKKRGHGSLTDNFLAQTPGIF